jgi:hypothetical protein
MSMDKNRNVWYWSPREEDLTRRAEEEALNTITNAMYQQKQMLFQTRPLLPTDMGLSTDTAFINYTGITGAGTFTIVNIQSTPQARPFAIFGFRNLNGTATGVITGIQAVVNGQTKPLKPIPLTLSWNEYSEKTVYFSPLYVTAPQIPVQISLTAAASAASVSFELIGITAQASGATLS